MITFCAKCVYPSTKPDLTFNEEGICSACLAYEDRKNIDWNAREEAFKKEIYMAKNLTPGTWSTRPYDCIIPVSGGKDSHFQIMVALKYDLKPLAITANTDDLSDIGRRNLDNIGRLGVDHITIQVNPVVRKRIAKHTLYTIGDISWAEHVTIFSIPVREAVLRKIPLIIWGENPQNEYGGPDKHSQSKEELDKTWLHEFGGLNGLRIGDIIDAGIATHEDMHLYYGPSVVQYSFEPRGIFLGQYFPWDGLENAKLMKKFGFEWSKTPVQGVGVPYENLDNYQTGIHDYFKWLKFGFGRATDIACNFIRRGYFTRDQAIGFVNRSDGEFPSNYLGKDINNVLKDIDMTLEDFLYVCDRFTNTQLFEPRVAPSLRPLLKFRLKIEE